MANNQITFDVNYKVNQTGLNEAKAALQQLKNLTLQDLTFVNKGTGLADAKIDLVKIQKSAEEVETALQKAFNPKLGVTSISSLKQQLDNLNIKEIYTNFSKAGSIGTRAFQQIGTAIMNTKLEVRQTNKFLSDMADTFVKTAKWSIASSAIQGITSSVQEAFQYTIDLDKSLNDIMIVTDKSSASMEKFAKQANKAAQELGKSTKDYTEASLIYYQQGLNDQDVAARTETTLKAANVTGQSTSEVSEQLTAVWNGYKVSANEAELYIDKLSAVAATTASDLEELSTGMSKVASAANLMGVDIDQLNATIATVVSVTRQAPESVGTAFKTIYARMGDIEAGLDSETTLGKYTEEMKAIADIDVLDANGQLRDMGTVIEEIGNKWTTLSREQQVALSQAMAGTRQYNNLLSLFDNWDMYTDAMNTSANAAGTLQKQQDIYMESTEAHLEKMATAGERVYDAFVNNDSFEGVIDLLTGIINGFGGWLEMIGGGGNMLLMLGTIATKVFRQQIASGLVSIVDYFAMANRNAQAFENKLNLLQAVYRETVEADPTGQGDAGSRVRAESMQALKDKKELAPIAQNQVMLDKYQQLTERKAQVASKRQQREQDRTVAKEYIKAQAKDMADNIKEKKGQKLSDNENNRQSALELNSNKYEKREKELENIILQNSNSDNWEQLTAKNEAEKELKQLNVQKEQDEQAINTKYNQQAANIEAQYQAKEEIVSKVSQEDFADTVLDSSNKQAQEEGFNLYGNMETDSSNVSEKITKVEKSYDELRKAIKKAHEEDDEGWEEIQKEIDKTVKKLEELKDSSSTLSEADKKGLEKEIKELKELKESGSVEQAKGKTLGKETQKVKEVNDARKEAVNAAVEQTSTQEEVLEAEEKDIADEEAILAKQAQVQQLSQGVVQMAEGFMSLGLAWQSFTQLPDLWDDEDISTGDKLVQTIMLLGQGTMSAVSSFGSLAQGFGSIKTSFPGLIAGLTGTAVAETATGTAATATGVAGKFMWSELLGPIGKALIVLAAVAAAFVGILVIINAINKANSPEAKLEKAKEVSADLDSNLQKANESAQALKDTLNNYDSAVAALEECTKGTAEWREALVAVNNEVLNLLDEYPELADMTKTINGVEQKAITYGKNGEMVIADWAREELEQQASDEQLKAQAASFAGKQAVRAAQVEVDRENIKDELFRKSGGEADAMKATTSAAIATTNAILSGGASLAFDPATYALVGYANSAALKETMSELIADNAETLGQLTPEDQVQWLRDAVQEQNLNVDMAEWEDLLNGVRGEVGDLISSINANTLAIDAENKTIATAALANNEKINDENANEEIKEDVYNTSGRLYEQLVEQEKKALEDAGFGTDGLSKRNKTGGRAKEYWNEYLDAIDKTSADLKLVDTTGTDKNREFVYKDMSADGEEKTIALEAMIESIATANALEALGASAEKLMEAFLDLESSGNDADMALKSLIANQNFSQATKAEFVDFQKELTEYGSTEEYLDKKFGDDKDGKISDTTAQAYGFESAEEWVETLEQQKKIAAEAWYNLGNDLSGQAEKAFDKVDTSGAFKNLELGQAENMVNMFQQAFNNAGREGSALLGDTLEDMFLAAGDEAGVLSDALVGVDWQNTNIEQLRDSFEDLGISAIYTDEQLQTVIDTMSKDVPKSFDEITTGYKELTDITDGLKYGDNITAEDYAVLKEEGLDEFFSANADGSYRLKVAANEFKDAVDDIKFDDFEENIAKLNEDIAILVKLLSYKDFDTFFDKASNSEMIDYLEQIGYGGDELSEWADAAAHNELTQDQINAIKEAVKENEGGWNNLEFYLDTSQNDLARTQEARASSVDDLAELDKLLKAGVITSEQYASAYGLLTQEIENSREELTDTLDVFRGVNNALEEINVLTADIQKKQEKSVGIDRINALNEELAILENQRDIIAQKNQLIDQQQAKLQNEASQYGFTFSDGQMTNAMTVLAQAQADLNAIETAYYNSTDSGKDALQQQLDDAKKRYEKVQALVDKNDDLVQENKAIQDELEAIADREIEIQIEKFNAKIEVELDLAEAEKEFKEFKKTVIDGIKDDDVVGNASFYLDQYKDYYKDDGIIQNLTEQVNKTAAELKIMESGGVSSVYGTDMARALEDLKTYNSELMSQMTDAESMAEEIDSLYMEAIDNVAGSFDKITAQYDRINEQYEHGMNLTKILYGEEAYEEMDKYYEKMEENNNNRIVALKEQAAYYQKMMESEQDDERREQWKELWESTISDLNGAVEDSAQLLKDKFFNSISAAFNQMEKDLTDGKGFDYLELQWELINKQSDLYLDNVNKAYEIQTLENKYLEGLNNTDTLKGQQKLTNLMNEQLEMLREKDNLTKYDVERANQLYDIAVKELALEEAKNNKSQMRLRRDVQGNYSYEFVADNDTISKYEQELLDAQNALYNLDKDALEENQEQIFNLTKERLEKEQELYNQYYIDQTITHDQYLEGMRLVEEEYGDLINSLTEENTVIRNNLQDSLFKNLIAMQELEVKEFEKMSQAQKDEMLNEIVPTWDTSIQTMINKFTNEKDGFTTVCKQGYDMLSQATKDWKTDINQLEESAKIDFYNIYNSVNRVANRMSNFLTDYDTFLANNQDKVTKIQNIANAFGNISQALAGIKSSATGAIEQANALYSALVKIGIIEETETPTVYSDSVSADARNSKMKRLDDENEITSGSSLETGTYAWDTLDMWEQYYSSDWGVLIPPSPVNWDNIVKKSSKYPNLSYVDAWKKNKDGSFDLMSQYSTGTDKYFYFNAGGIYEILDSSNGYILTTDKKGKQKWVEKEYFEGFDTGGYTGDWNSSDGKVAVLHQKELVLNAKDTENMLTAVSIVRDIDGMLQAIDSSIMNRMADLMLSFDSTIPSTSSQNNQTVSQTIYIDAEFPEVESAKEIKEAFENLANVATMRAFNTER